MKKYNEMKIEVLTFDVEDVLTTSVSGEVEGDETKYPIPEDWAN